MTPEEEKAKKLSFEENQFKKKWAKMNKLSPLPSKVSKNVGHSVKCNTRPVVVKAEPETKNGSKKKK